MKKNEMQTEKPKEGLELEGDRDRLFSGKMVKLRHELIEHF